jgi:hypothetical protein
VHGHSTWPVAEVCDIQLRCFCAFDVTFMFDPQMQRMQSSRVALAVAPFLPRSEEHALFSIYFNCRSETLEGDGLGLILNLSCPVFGLIFELVAS